MSKIQIMILTILFLPITLPYWFAWAIIEVMRDDDGTMWTVNPLSIKPKQK